MLAGAANCLDLRVAVRLFTASERCLYCARHGMAFKKMHTDTHRYRVADHRSDHSEEHMEGWWRLSCMGNLRTYECSVVRRGTGGNPGVGRQDSVSSISSSGNSGSQPTQTRGFYPAPPAAGGAPPQQNAASHAFPAGVAPPPTHGEPTWRSANRGVYPEIGSPTDSGAANTGADASVAAYASHSQGPASAQPPPAGSTAVPTADEPASAQLPSAAHGDVARPARAKHHAPEPMHGAPSLWVPAPTRVTPGSSVPRDDLWYTSFSRPGDRADLDGHVYYPTVEAFTSPAPDEAVDSGGVRAEEGTADAAQPATQSAEVSLCCGYLRSCVCSLLHGLNTAWPW